MLTTNSTTRRLIGAAVAALALVSAACSSSGSAASTTGTGSGGTIKLVAYSTPQAAYNEIEAAFEKTSAGKGVHFQESYGASGDQSRAVAAGQPADYVAFSLEPDVTRLVKAGLVATTWNANQYKGMVTESVVVFLVRKGNPKNIKTWDDLIKPGVKVLTPNPFSSGSARWNIMAAYGAQLKQGKTPAEAQQYLDEAVQERGRAGHQRPQRPRELHQRQGRRAARRTRTTPSSPSRRASRSTTSSPTRRS